MVVYCWMSSMAQRSSCVQSSTDMPARYYRHTYGDIPNGDAILSPTLDATNAQNAKDSWGIGIPPRRVNTYEPEARKNANRNTYVRNAKKGG